MTIQELADEVLNYFEWKKRKPEDSDYIFIAKDVMNLPKWIRDMCYEAHNGMFPDDYKYEYIANALNIISECDSIEYLEDNLWEYTEADVYTSSLTEWLNSSNFRMYYLDDFKKEFGSDGDAFNELSGAQVMERQEVFYTVKKHLEERLEEIELEEEEEYV